MRASVTVTYTAQDRVVAFSTYDPELITTLKESIPQGKRSWNRKNQDWHVSKDIDLAEVLDKFQQLGAQVISKNHQKPQQEQHSQVREDRTAHNAEHWKKQYEAMSTAAQHLQAEVLRLREELVDSIRPAPSSGTWAEQLLITVGELRADAVYRALSRCLHPDVATGDTILMQQLNDARHKTRRS